MKKNMELRVIAMITGEKNIGIVLCVFQSDYQV